MKITKITKAVVLLAIPFAVGCELIVDFDRTKIPVEVSEDATAPETGTPETSTPTDDAGSVPPSDADTSDAADASDSG